jgi:hypothetical protein
MLGITHALLGLAMLATGASAEQSDVCPQAVTLACGADAGSQDMIIYFNTSSGSDNNYFRLKPHGAKGRTKRCTDADILIEDSSVQLSINRRTGQFIAVGKDDERWAGVCTVISAPDAGPPRQ